jgi:hypothetical protein
MLKAGVAALPPAGVATLRRAGQEEGESDQIEILGLLRSVCGAVEAYASLMSSTASADLSALTVPRKNGIRSCDTARRDWLAGGGIKTAVPGSNDLCEQLIKI